ncbi:MAG: cytochrome c [Flavobacteriales bacterium]|nr:cytochrome c [Flavobacteriales bacterium]
MRISCKHLIVSLGAILCFLGDARAQDGASIFKQNCGACHALGKRLVGPDLIGVNERRNDEWLLKFIKSSQALIQSGDADAAAVYAEFNQIAMPDQSHLGDDQIRSILAYIEEETLAKQSVAATQETPKEEAPVVVIEYSEADVASGLALFSGKKRLSNGGPSCISCHNVNNNALVSGGLLAKDLTDVYTRMGNAGVAGILSAPPFPAMASAYNNNALDSSEIAQLTAFLQHADNVSEGQQAKSGANIFILGGGGGLVVLLLLIATHWNRRLRTSVKHDIYKRQIKSI